MRSIALVCCVVLCPMIAEAQTQTTIVVQRPGLLSNLLGGRQVTSQPYQPSYQYAGGVRAGYVAGGFATVQPATASVQCVPIQTQAVGVCQQAASRATCAGSSSASAGVTLEQVMALQYHEEHLQVMNSIANNTAEIGRAIDRNTIAQDDNLEEIEDTLDGILQVLQKAKEIQEDVQIQPVPSIQQMRAPRPSGSPSILPQPMGLLPAKRTQRVVCPDGQCPNVMPYPVPVERPRAEVSSAIPTVAIPSAVVKIESKLGPYSRLGSGVHIGGEYVLSCAHILKAKWEPVVITTDGRKWPCQIVATDALSDLSLLKVQAERFDAKFIPVSEYQPQPEDAAIMSGMSGGYRAWPGKVVGYMAADMVVKGVGVREGDSGGPIVVNGAVVSVISEFTPSDQHTTGACSRDVVAFLKKAGVPLGKE